MSSFGGDLRGAEGVQKGSNSIVGFKVARGVASR